MPSSLDFDINVTNVKIGDIKTVLSGTTHNLSDLAKLSAVNKFGIWRGAISGADCAARKTAIATAPHPEGGFRYYHHGALETGFVDVSSVIASPDATTSDRLFSTQGAYTISKPAWVNILALTELDIPNHPYVESGGYLTGGTDDTDIVANWRMFGKLRISVTSNDGAYREGTVTINSPDDENKTISVRQSGTLHQVDPAFHNFAWNETGSANKKTSIVDIPAVYDGNEIDSWTITSTTPSWLSITAINTGEYQGSIEVYPTESHSGHGTDRIHIIKVAMVSNGLVLTSGVLEIEIVQAPQSYS